MSKLGEKLQRLLQLATIREGEEENEGRMNEARTSAFLLLRECQKHGVKISFKIPKAATPAPPPVPPSPPQPPVQRPHAPDPGTRVYPPNWNAGFGDFYRNGGADIFEELFRQAAGSPRAAYDDTDEVQRRFRAEEAKRREKERQHEQHFRRPAYAKPRTEPSYEPGKDGAPPIISAQYSKRCRECGVKYEQGERVYWVRGAGCSHIACGYEQLQQIAGNG